MASTPEGKVKKKIKKVLDNIPGLYYDMPVPSGYGKSGLDFYGCYIGEFFAIEAKAPKKGPTALQEETLRRIEEAGGKTFVISDERGVQLLDAWLEMRSVQ
jgi:hypothetical protein